ncbi:MAG: hypothetical protein DWQ10_07560 [Calditrichaeota bacterium]|nr:MAG: hypothetical protein DWQ10_07560 [Calditrichota bacterium]
MCSRYFFKIPAIFLLICFAPVAGQTLEEIMEEIETDDTVDTETFLRSYLHAPVKLHKISPDSAGRLWFLENDQSQTLYKLMQNHSGNLSYRKVANALKIPEEMVRILFEIPMNSRRFFSHRARFKYNEIGRSNEQKFKYTQGGTLVHATLERDAGEARFDDFKSAAISSQLFNEKTRIVLGDYTIQNATGLAFAGSFHASILSSAGSSVKFSKMKVRPYSSISENLALRGLAVDTKLGSSRFLAFFSSARRDAAFDEFGTVVSRPNTGIHITESELIKKDALGERIAGMMIKFPIVKNFTIGGSHSRTVYARFIRSPDSVRQRFNFTGRSKTMTSIDFLYQLKDTRTAVVGEIVRFDWGARAEVFGMRRSSKKSKLSLLFWNATADFVSDYGALPNSRIGDAGNNLGIYLGILFKSRLGTIDVSLRREKTHWRTYFWPQPIEKQIFNFFYENSTFKKLKFITRLKTSLAPQNRFVAANAMQLQSMSIENSVLNNLYFKTIYRFSGKSRYQFRFDYTRIRPAAEPEFNGWAQSHETHLQIKQGMRIKFRYTLFTIEDYLSRIYHFDYRFPDLLQPIPLTGMGKRMVFNYQIRFPLFEFSGFWFNEMKRGQKPKNGWGLQINFRR